MWNSPRHVTPLPLTERIARAWVDETHFDVRRALGRAVSFALPQFAFNRTRTVALRALGMRIGTGSRVMGSINVTGPGDARRLLSIGVSSFISGPLHVDIGAEVRIGDRVQIGHHVVLLTVEHAIGPSEDRCGPLRFRPVTIDDGAWIATRVTILPGVTIGKGAIVAAGAVVARNVAPNTLVAGVPAKVVRSLPPDGSDHCDYADSGISSSPPGPASTSYGSFG